MKRLSVMTLTLSVVGAPLFADGHATGDADAGEKVFRKCKSCHAIVADDGTAIQKGGATGPNLFGIDTRQAGAVGGYKFGHSIIAAGDAGLVWNEADFIEYVANPKQFLAAYLDDKKARSKMSFKLKNSEDAANAWAYLVSVGPEVAASN